MVGYWSIQWRSMKGYFRDINAFGVDYEGAEGYDRAKFDAPETLTINELKARRDLGPCF